MMASLSLRAAINRKCRECIHDPHGGGGNWRQQVEACSSANCPLHAVRPISKPKNEPRDVGGYQTADAPEIALLESEKGLFGAPSESSVQGGAG